MNLIVMIAAGVLALIALLIGVIRKFQRVSWLSWQIAAVFALTLLVGVLPAPAQGLALFGMYAGILAGGSMLVLAAGGAVRHAMLSRMSPAPLFFRILSRLLGGITALLNLAVFLAVLGAPVLAALPLFNVQPSALSFLYENALWREFAAPHAVDLLLCALCVVLIRAGYRIGFARSLWTILAVALGIAALGASVFLAVRVPFLASFAAQIAGGFPQLGAAAGVVGTLNVAAICFVVLLVVIILITLLANLLLRSMSKVTALRLVDGAIMAVVFAALFFGIALGFDAGVRFLAEQAAGLPAAEAVAPVARSLEAFVQSSPLSALFYLNNPLLLLFA